MYWQAFPPGGESDLSARHQQVVLKKKCPAIETIIQYKPGAGGGLMWAQMNQLPADGLNIVGVNLPHIVFQPIEGQVQYKTEDIDAGLLVPLHAGRAGGARVEPDQDLRGLRQGRQGRPGQAHPRRLGPQLGQPRRARAHERRVRRQDHLRAVQGHRRHDDGGARRPRRRRDDLHRVRDQQQGQGARAGGGDGQAPPAAARRADLQGTRRRLGRRRLPRHRRAEVHAARASASACPTCGPRSTPIPR